MLDPKAKKAEKKNAYQKKKDPTVPPEERRKKTVWKIGPRSNFAKRLRRSTAKKRIRQLRPTKFATNLSRQLRQRSMAGFGSVPLSNRAKHANIVMCYRKVSYSNPKRKQ